MKERDTLSLIFENTEHYIHTEHIMIGKVIPKITVFCNIFDFDL